MERDEENQPFYANKMVLMIVAYIAFTGFINYLFNLQTTILFLLTGFLTHFYLESANYIEHYGLMRKKLENGEY